MRVSVAICWQDLPVSGLVAIDASTLGEWGAGKGIHADAAKVCRTHSQLIGAPDRLHRSGPEHRHAPEQNTAAGVVPGRLRPALDLSRSGRSEGQKSSAIPLNATALREWLDFHRRHAPKATYVFIDRFGARIASIKITFYAVAEQAGLPGISPHPLWHIFTVWPVQASVPLRTVCELCRHKDIRTTLQYAFLAPDNTRDAIAVLDGFEAAHNKKPALRRA